MIAINAEEIVNRLKKVIIHSLKHIMIIALPVVIIFVILSGIAWFIFDDEGTWDENEKGNPKSATKTAKLDTTNGISMDLETTLRQGLSDMGLSEERIEELMNNKEELIDMLKMTEKLKRTITPDNLFECTEAEILWCLNSVYSKYLENPEQLQYLINAELVTQYPKLDDIPSDKLNGIIQFKRMKKDDDGNISEIYLKYKTLEEYNKIYNDYSQNRNTDIFNYFTINDEGEVIVARWINTYGEFESNNSKKQTDRKKIDPGYDQARIQSDFNSLYNVTGDTEDSINATYAKYEISNVKINYKSLVEKYTLPFEYLWSLVVMGESSNFVVNLAELAYNSTIEIGIYDNINTRISTERKEYTEEFREGYNKYHGSSGSENDRLESSTKWSGCEEEKHSYYYQEVVTYKTNEVQFDILNADVWIIQAVSNYENKIDDGTPNVSTQNIDDEEWSDDGENPQISKNSHEHYKTINKGTEYEESVLDYIDYKTTYTYKEKKRTGQKNTSTLQENISKYQKVGETIVNPKVDINENTSNNFVKLLRADTKAFNLLTTNSTREWLLGILKKNQDTTNMVDLTKMLIEKARNPDADVKIDLKFDFDTAYQTPIINNMSTLSGNTIQEKVWCALINAGFSEYAVAGAMGNIQAESGFRISAVEGGSGIGFGLCQWSYGRRTSLEAFAASRGVLASDESIQIEYLLGELTPGGGADGYASYQLLRYHGYDGNSWRNATSPEDAATAFCWSFERPGTARLEARISAAKTFYDMYNGTNTQNVNITIADVNGELSAQNQLKMTQLLNEAVRIANDDSYTYLMGGNGNNKQFDCSHFVYYLYTSYFNISVPCPTASYGSTGYIGNDGQVNLKAGDILWKSGHVAIYIGGGNIAEAWGRVNIAIPDQIRVTSYRQGRFTKIYRFINS